ncbi:MAG: hypothetical protein ABR912_09905 [Terracidiphilus sp.]
MKTLKVTFVESGQIAKSKRSSQETGIRYDMSQFYSMKDVMEQLFGKRAYLCLKETASLKDWKDSTIKLLNAILLATESSIAVADDDWRNEITDAVKRGITLISSADHISDLFSCLAATLTGIVFVQIGCMPNHRSEQKTVRLTKDWWTLSHFRSVQYIQSEAQKAALVQAQEKRKAAKQKQQEHENQSN